MKHLSRSGRRPRVPLSCDACRTRKLRCNRENPCQNCIARNEQTACRFQGTQSQTSNIAYQADQRSSMQQRIDDLEVLVKRLIDQHHKASPSAVDSPQGIPRPEPGSGLAAPGSTESDVTFSGGRTVTDGVHSVYTGTDDWFDVLQEINKLKEVWNKTQEDHPTLSNIVDGPSLLFGNPPDITVKEILATLPPKAEVDKLLCYFFDRDSFPITVAPILHETTFMREYIEHWNRPSQTSIIWIGLLFSILGIVMLAYRQYEEPPEYQGISESLFQLYQLRTAQCLIIGDITKCLPYTIETLRFNATAELNRKDDSSRGLWIMSGVIVRAAINMGYHRDPYQLTSISILEAEYRRRVWLSVIGMDDMASFLVGFPRMMLGIYSDTVEPRNLHDWELSDDTSVLPPSRPLTESTSTSYLIIKGRLFRALGRITDFNNTITHGSYATVLEIDESLCTAYRNISLDIKLPGRADNRHDLSKLQLESMYHRGMCALHRRFMVRGRFDAQYKLSRDRCISSALALLGYQKVLEPSWYAFSQTRQMLTHAAMILFLELEHERRSSGDEMPPDSGHLLDALTKSCALWEESKDSCDEVSKVHGTLAGMLSSFQTVAETTSIQTQPSESLFVLPGTSPYLYTTKKNLPLQEDHFDLPNDMDIDWVTWDSFIEDTIFDDRAAE